MSFPRAKIQRFNDVTSDNPSPADYNPLNPSTPTGAVIPRSSRFSEIKSPPNSHNTSVSSTSSLNKSGIFRSPKLLRKKRSPKDSQDRKDEHEIKDKEMLHDKIVECENKDETIKELSEVIDQYKLKLEQLQTDFDELNTVRENLEHEKIEMDHEYSKKYEELKIFYDEINQSVVQKFKCLSSEIKGLKLFQRETYEEIFGSIQLDIDHFKAAHKEVIEKSELELKEKNKKLEELQNFITELESKHQFLVENFEVIKMEELEKEKRMFKDVLDEVNRAVDEYKGTIRDLEGRIDEHQKQYCSLLADKSKEKVEEELLLEKSRYEDLKQQKEIEIKRIIFEQEESWRKTCTIRVTAVQEELTKEIEDVKSKKKKLENIFEQQNKEFGILSHEHEALLKEYKKIQSQCKGLEGELQNKLKVLEELESKFEEQEGIRNGIADKNKYELKINNLLLEVKTLSSDLAKCKETINNLTEVMKLQGNDQMEAIAKLSEQYNEDLDVYAEAIIKKFQQLQLTIDGHESEFIRNISQVKSALEMSNKDLIEARNLLDQQEKLNLKIQNVCSEAAGEELDGFCKEEVEKLRVNYLEFKTLKESLSGLSNGMRKISDVIERNSEEQTLINHMQEDEKLQKFKEEVQNNLIEITHYMKNIKKQFVEYKVLLGMKNLSAEPDKEKILELERECQKLQQEVCGMEEIKRKNAELERALRAQEILIGPFRQQLENYERDMSLLQSQKNWAMKEMEDMTMKYTEMLGHQNHKQKIKHLLDLKRNNNDLKESNKILESKCRAQSKQIEKLKRDAASKNSPRKRSLSLAGNQENICSPEFLRNATNTK